MLKEIKKYFESFNYFITLFKLIIKSIKTEDAWSNITDIKIAESIEWLFSIERREK